MNQFGTQLLMGALVVCAVSTLGSGSPHDDLYFERISLEQGLSQSTVNAIVQDQRGYMWFGTLNGLNKYDGYTFTDFRHIANDTSSLSNDQIYAIAEDSFGDLWIGTSYGLNRFDRKSQNFVRYHCVDGDSTSISNDKINVIYEDRSQVLWVGTASGLCRYQPQSDDFTRFVYDPNRVVTLSHPYISAILEDTEGTLWVGSYGGGLSKFNLERTEIEHILPVAGDRGLQYTPELMSGVVSLVRSRQKVASILRVGEQQTLRKSFDIARETDVLVVACGEITEKPNDHSWIEHGGKVIWRMTNDDSRHAGGAAKNRLQLEILRLSPGHYELVYQSDTGHSYGNWNQLPPARPELWGVQLVDVAEPETRWVQARLPRNFVASRLSSSSITSIVESRAGGLWVTTRDGGLAMRIQPDAGNETRRGQPDQRFAPAPAVQPGKVRWAGLSPESAALSWNIVDLPEKPQPAADFYVYGRYPDAYVETLSQPAMDTVVALVQRIRPIAALSRVGDNAMVQRRFTVTRETDFLVVAMGEFSGSWLDFGRLKTTAGDSVWQMGTRKSLHAGGGAKNRLSLEILTLAAGDYELEYTSDHLHSFDGWTQPAPHHPELWGVRLLPLSGRQKTELVPLLSRYTVPPQIAANSIRTAVPDLHGDIWLATFNGLSKFDPVSGSVVNYVHDAMNPSSLSTNDIQSIYEDRAGTIWIGTVLGGINKMTREKNRFKTYTTNPFVKSSLRVKMTYAFCEDRDGLIWIGTWDGLNLFNPATERFFHFVDNGSRLGEIRGNVTSIIQDRRGFLWIGTGQRGLYRIDPGKFVQTTADEHGFAIIEGFGQDPAFFRQYKPDRKDSTSLSHYSIWSVLEDSRGDIWVGTQGGGLCRLPAEFTSMTRTGADSTGDGFIRYVHHGKDSTSLSHNGVRKVFEDRSGTIWLGTNRGGLCKLDRETGEFTCYHHRLGDSTSLSHNSVTSIHEDADGYLWVTTYGGGLNRFDVATGTCKRYSETDGLPNNVLYGALPDSAGNLWLSSNHGISRFDVAAETFKNYDLDNGLQSYEFNTGAYLKTQAGDLIFGGIAGFNVIHPDQIRDNHKAPTVVITALKKFDKEVEFDRDLADLDEIELSYEENFISFEFASLDYTNPRKNQYAYRLLGLNKEWVNCGNRRFASFTNLSPGNYVFHVKASNNDGVWNENGASLKITILPPFWQTTWFLLASLASFILLLVALHKKRVQVKIRQSLQLERVRIQERERMREQVSRDYHDEVGHKLTKITLFSELLSRKLNGASGESGKYVRKIVDAADNLGRDTRDFIWTLNPEKDTLHDFGLYLSEFGESLFEDTQIMFLAKLETTHVADVKLSMDLKRHLALIFKEAMHNVLKHSGCSTSELQVACENETLQVSLYDNGAGISREGHPAATVSGNGMNNMHQRARKVGGRLQVRSRPDSGTRVSFEMRIPRTGYSA